MIDKKKKKKKKQTWMFHLIFEKHFEKQQPQAKWIFSVKNVSYEWKICTGVWKSIWGDIKWKFYSQKITTTTAVNDENKK